MCNTANNSRRPTATLLTVDHLSLPPPTKACPLPEWHLHSVDWLGGELLGTWLLWLTPFRQGQFLPAAPSIPSCGLPSIQGSSQHAPQLSLLGPPSPRCPFGVKACLRRELRTTKKCPQAQVSLEKQARAATGLAEQMETKETHGVSRPRGSVGHHHPPAHLQSPGWTEATVKGPCSCPSGCQGALRSQRLPRQGEGMKQLLLLSEVSEWGGWEGRCGGL